jgi:alkylated DNA repair dioxygenase AlkB
MELSNKPYVYRPDYFSAISFDQIDKALIWENRDAPRDESYYATENYPYTYGKGNGQRTYFPHIFHWHKPGQTINTLEYIWEKINNQENTSFELLFCNKYMDQHQHLGWHADDSPSVDSTKPIVVVTFGAEREIWFREVIQDRGKPFDAGIFYGPIEKLTLGHGSLLIMKAGMQQTYQHRIPKHDRPCGPRISLTFRGLALGHKAFVDED